jgi:MFS family permease
VPVGRISDRTDRRYVITAAAIGAGLTGLAIVLLDPGSAALALTLTALYGALTYPIYGLAVAQANDFADPADFVAISGGLLLLYGVGTIFGPLAGGAAMSAIGPEGMFAVTAISHASIAGYAMYRTFKRAPVPEGVREAHMPVAGQTSTPQTAALDPRAEEAPAMEREALAAVK